MQNLKIVFLFTDDFDRFLRSRRSLLIFHIFLQLSERLIVVIVFDVSQLFEECFWVHALSLRFIQLCQDINLVDEILSIFLGFEI